MRKIKYKKAPVSEVIFGIHYNKPIFSENGFIFDVITKIKDKYSKMNYVSPIADEILDGYSLNTQINPINSGPVLYRLSSEDSHWLVQLQFNKMFFNWLRKDIEKVGNYPGYSTIYSRFNEIVEQINNIVKSNKEIKYYELTYNDRIFWKDLIPDLSEIDKLINIKVPNIKIGSSNNYPNNIISNYSIPLDKIGGYSKISIATATVNNKQILSFQCTIRGHITDIDIDDWFDSAHSIQIDLFQELFNDEVLKKWK